MKQTSIDHSSLARPQRPRWRVLRLGLAVGLGCGLLPSCMVLREDLPREGLEQEVVVSVKDQEMVLLDKGVPVRSYKVSTSKYGLGDQPGSYRTPLGRFKIAEKYGDGACIGTVFKARRKTREIVSPDTHGRDPVVTRVLWLKGLDPENRNAYRRLIYIHGTPEESKVGTPASYGCIRMKSDDIVDLFARVRSGLDVRIQKESLYRRVFVIAGPIAGKADPAKVGDPQRDETEMGLASVTGRPSRTY